MPKKNLTPRGYYSPKIKSTTKKREPNFFLVSLIKVSLVIVGLYVMYIYKYSPQGTFWLHFIRIDYMHLPLLVILLLVISALSTVFDSDPNIQHNIGHWINKSITYIILSAIPFFIFDFERRRNELSSLTVLIENSLDGHIEDYYGYAKTFEKKLTAVNYYNTIVPIPHMVNNFQSVTFASITKSYGKNINKANDLMVDHRSFTTNIFHNYSGDEASMDSSLQIEDKDIIEEILDLNFHFYTFLNSLPYLLSDPLAFEMLLNGYYNRVSSIEESLSTEKINTKKP